MSILRVESTFTEQLPGQAQLDPKRRQTPKSCWAAVTPQTFAKPSLLAYSSSLYEALGGAAILGEGDAFLSLVSGQAPLADIQPYAMNYGGHQFGHWAGQLGDGRAINLGEVASKQQRYTLQIKGAGETPYSRSGDGLAVLRSSIREFLCSEAMHYLGVPTTRALSLVRSGEQVMRDMFYDGRPELEPGAIVCRVAPSFIRFGNFQIHAARHEESVLKRLLDYTLATHFPQFEPDAKGYLKWLEWLRDHTIELIVHWMRVGFVHGVMNTDNLSIHGLTIDYGPYGWLDAYEPDWTPNTTDAGQKRYRFENQPYIAHWNFVQLAQAVYPLIGELEPLQVIVDEFPTRYQAAYRQMMLKKLGLEPSQGERADEQDDALIQQWLATLLQNQADYTLIHRALARWDGDMATVQAQFAECFYHDAVDWPGFCAVLELYAQRATFIAEKTQRMNQVNPCFILRNFLAQEAIEQAQAGDDSGVLALFEALKSPYQETEANAPFIRKRPDWAKTKAGCSMLSCSS